MPEKMSPEEAAIVLLEVDMEMEPIVRSVFEDLDDVVLDDHHRASVMNHLRWAFLLGRGAEGADVADLTTEG